MTKPLDLEQIAAKVLAAASAVKGDEARLRDVLELLERVRANSAAADLGHFERQAEAARREAARLSDERARLYVDLEAANRKLAGALAALKSAEAELEAIRQRPTPLTEKP